MNPPKSTSPALSPDALRAEVTAGRIGPLYLIEGTDEVLKSELAALFAEAIEPELRAFNVERVYATDTTFEPRVIVDAVRTLPMMAPRRVVIVLEAEKALNPKRESEAADQALEPLAACIEEPVPSTTLVFVVHDKLDGNRRMTRLVRRHAVGVACGDVGSGAQARRDVAARAREAGLAIDGGAVSRLVELATVRHEREPDTIDSAKLRADTERVLLFVGQGTVTAAHVDQVAERVEQSRGTWAMNEAIERGDARAALRELRVRLDAGDNVFQMMGQIGWAVRNPKGRIPERRLQPAVEALLRTDIALKSSGGNPRMLLERLIVELCG